MYGNIEEAADLLLKKGDMQEFLDNKGILMETYCFWYQRLLAMNKTVSIGQIQKAVSDRLMSKNPDRGEVFFASMPGRDSVETRVGNKAAAGRLNELFDAETGLRPPSALPQNVPSKILLTQI
jgi:hypothetical protein